MKKLRARKNIQKIVEKLEASDPDLQERLEALGKLLDKETEGDNTYAKEVKAVSEKSFTTLRGPELQALGGEVGPVAIADIAGAM